MVNLAQDLRIIANRIEAGHHLDGVNWKAKQIETWGKLCALWEALDGGPSPACRDCADNCGTCEHDGLPCDPQERAIEQIRRLRAASS